MEKRLNSFGVVLGILFGLLFTVLPAEATQKAFLIGIGPINTCPILPARERDWTISGVRPMTFKK